MAFNASESQQLALQRANANQDLQENVQHFRIVRRRRYKLANQIELKALFSVHA